MRYFFNLRYLLILPVMVMALLVTACGTALPTIKPFKLDVQQGNVVTSKMLLQLRPGMTKSQVRFIMGTPLIQDSFHGNRWDYVYQLREGGKVKEQRRVILDFENELLKTVRGDVVPAGSDQAKAAAEPENIGTRVVEPNAKAEDKTLLGKLKFWDKDEAAKSAAKAESNKQMDVPVELTPAGQVANDAPKSLLEVPVEAMPLEGAAVTPSLVEPATVESPVSVEAAPVVAAPAVVEQNVTPVVAESIKTTPEVPAQKLTEPALPEPIAPVPPNEVLPVEVPAQPAPYESNSGMLFDRTLKLEPEAAPAQTAKPAPRAGNTTPPKPKELPAENSSGFFDRMLEKIGF